MKYLIAACLIIAAAPSQADVPVEQAIELCRAEQNALRRLTCYDAINDTGLSIKQPSVSKAQETTTAEQNFGIEHKNILTDDSPDKVYMTVEKVSRDVYKSLIVQFDNGQVWHQLGTEYYSVQPGERHYIKRGTLNSFLMGSDDSRKAIRVRREQ